MVHKSRILQREKSQRISGTIQIHRKPSPKGCDFDAKDRFRPERTFRDRLCGQPLLTQTGLPAQEPEGPATERCVR
jgi:hypothetical protein